VAITSFCPLRYIFCRLTAQIVVATGRLHDFALNDFAFHLPSSVPSFFVSFRAFLWPLHLSAVALHFWRLSGGNSCCNRHSVCYIPRSVSPIRATEPDFLRKKCRLLIN
jgi:hypothetical protein